ncbi:RNA-directed DNA polymerase, eukaryota [Tanacetum coccineum]
MLIHDLNTFPRIAHKAKKNWVKELCVSNKVNLLALQETKMEYMDLFTVKRCWENFAFDFVHSDAVGNSGGILCAWDTNSFQKSSSTVSDYFVIIRGWLWMGDFNEVRDNSEEIGVIFLISVVADKEMDAEIDKGTATDDTLKEGRRTMQLLLIQANKIKASKVAQKAKNSVAWRRENSRFYHGGFIEAVMYFFSCGDVPKGSHSSFIALIPKVPGANMVKDFRPISLIGCIHKIIGKIMANRLVGVLGDIVSEEQSAFIANRQILDGPFILNEVMHWCKAKKKQALIFKVDFEKAYDSVRWDFLDEVLDKFGFGNKWRRWVQNSLNSSRGSILVNGSPTVEFQFYKGLKQGDPLSPFLFILIMESLHLSFQRVVEAGMFSGISLSLTLTLSHMFYADDAIFSGNWKEGNIDVLVNVLECFHQVSGLRINMCKSKILGIHVADVPVKQAAAKLGCLVLNTPFVYLGTKVGAKISRVNEWNEVVEKSSALWVRVVKAIHGEEGKMNSNNIYSMGSCWLNIVKEVRMLATKGVNAMEFVRHKLGNGEMTRFWEDTWMIGCSLKDSFPKTGDGGTRTIRCSLERYEGGGVIGGMLFINVEGRSYAEWVESAWGSVGDVG